MTYITVQIKRFNGNEDIPLPGYMTEGSAGMDLYAAIKGELKISCGESKLIPCGFSIAVPDGYEAQIRPRSGLAFEYGITVLNSPGTIDSDYRGEVQIILINLGLKEVTIKRGMRIAQLLVAPVPKIKWEEVNQLPDTGRGKGGAGHTGS